MLPSDLVRRFLKPINEAATNVRRLGREARCRQRCSEAKTRGFEATLVPKA